MSILVLNNKKDYIMLKLRNGVLLSTLLFLSSCMDEDLSKISSSVSLNPDIAIPLVQSTTTLGDLLPDDDNIYVESDSSIRIAFSSDDIAKVESDSFLEFENQDPTVENFTIGVITLPDFSQNQTILLRNLGENLEDPIIAAEIENAFTLAASNGNYAPFPTIDRQSGGSYTQSASDEFERVTMSEGNLSMQIFNNMGITIDYIKLQLKNNDASNKSLIGEFEFQNIAPDDDKTISLSLSGKEMYKDISFDVVAVEIMGTGPNVFDPSTYVELKDTDNILLNISGSGISVTEGKVKFPEQTGPAESFAFDLDLDDDVSIDFINLSGGALEYTFSSSVNTTLELDFEITQLKNPMGASFKRTLMIQNTGTGQQKVSIPLDGYKFVFDGSDNQLDVLYSSKITDTDGFAFFNQNDFVNLSIGIVDLDFSYVEGYFGQIIESIDPGELDVDVSLLEDITSGIKLETPELIFTVNNSLGIPFEIDLNFEGSNGTKSESLTNTTFNIPSGLGTSISKKITFNEANNLSELIAIAPSVISYGGTVTTNPNGNQGPNSISPGTGVSFGYEMELPLYLRISEAVTTDTLAIDLSDSDDSMSDDIEEVSLKLNVKNEFPLDVNLMILFSDSLSGNDLDSLEVDLLKAAEVDDHGKTIAPEIYTTEISLDSDQIDALFDANQILLDIKIASYDFENKAVRLYTNYTIEIDAGVRIKSKIEE